MHLLESCQSLFGTDDVYSIFKVKKKCSQSELKKAYYKVSLKVHPDKVADNEKDKSTNKFQLLSKIYTLLSDDKLRKIFDKTGEFPDGDEFGFSEDRDWMEYWRELFPPISVDDIDNFKSNYQGSAEELADLKDAYTKSKGDMGKILDLVMCSTVEDEDRFRELLQPFIDSKELPTCKKFSSESTLSKKQRQSKAKKESKEAAAAEKELKSGSVKGFNDLALAMQANRKKRAGVMSYLEEKYCSQEDCSGDDLIIDTGKSKKSKAGTSKLAPKRRKKA